MFLGFGRDDEKVPLFYADSGDLHLKYPDLTPFETREFRLKGEFFVKVHERVGLDAQGVGDLDLALGWPYLRDLYKDSPVTLISANIFEKATGKRAFPAYVVREKAGLKVAFIGALSNKKDAALPREIAEKLEVRDPEPLIKAAIEELDAVKPDLIVLVSHLGKDWDVGVADRVPGIDLILGGHSGEALVPPVEKVGVPICQAGKRGKKVGRIDLWYNPAGEPGAEEYRDFHKTKRKTAAEFKKKLTYVHRLEPIKKAFEEDPEVADWIAGYKQMIYELPPLDDAP